MNRLMGLISTGLCAIACLQVHALRPNFTYVQAGYVTQDVDSCDQDGLFLGGSYEINSQAFAVAEISDISGDPCGSESLSAGYGLRGDYGNNSTFYGLGRVISRDDNFDRDIGLGGEFGLRTILVEGVELNAMVGFEKIDDFDQIFAGVGIDYWLGQGFSVAGNLVLNDESDTSISVAARYHF